MRKLIVKVSVSFDGYMTSTDGTHDWMFPSYSDDAGEWTIATLERTAEHLMGATTYHHMASAWPGSDSVYAPYMNEQPKIVFSRSLTDVAWDKTRIMSGDLAEDITALKATDEPAGILLAHGGPTFARSLVATGLVDEYQVIVHPVVLGAGRSIFAAEAGFTVRDVRQFSSGAVGYTMTPAPFPGR